MTDVPTRTFDAGLTVRAQSSGELAEYLPRDV
jgi:hypothetical protein